MCEQIKLTTTKKPKNKLKFIHGVDEFLYEFKNAYQDNEQLHYGILCSFCVTMWTIRVDIQI